MIDTILDFPPEITPLSLKIVYGYFPDGFHISILSYHFWNLAETHEFSDDYKNEVEDFRWTLDKMFLSFLVDSLSKLNLTIDHLRKETFMDGYFVRRDLNLLILNSFLLNELIMFGNTAEHFTDGCHDTVEKYSPELLAYFKKVSKKN